MSYQEKLKQSRNNRIRWLLPLMSIAKYSMISVVLMTKSKNELNIWKRFVGI